MTSYELSRAWFDWCFENPEKVKPNHTALYFFCIELCNRLGWKQKFGLPSSMAMEAIGIRSYNTYISALNDLIEFGFIDLIEKSKNQYTANIIALSKFDGALDKALDRAHIAHLSKQDENTRESSTESTSSINKQENQKQENESTINHKNENVFDSKKNEDFISEKKFIEIWTQARLHYDNAKTAFDKLVPFERQCFNQLASEFSASKFEKAVAGLFFQDTVPAVRVRPDHFLKRENFEKYLDCWINQSKMFDNSRKNTTTGKNQYTASDSLQREIAERLRSSSDRPRRNI